MDLLQKQFEEHLGMTKEEFLRISPSLGRYLINQAKLLRKQKEKRSRGPIYYLFNLCWRKINEKQ